MLDEIASVNNVTGYVNVDEDIKVNISYTFSERFIRIISNIRCYSNFNEPYFRSNFKEKSIFREIYLVMFIFKRKINSYFFK